MKEDSIVSIEGEQLLYKTSKSVCKFKIKSGMYKWFIDGKCTLSMYINC